MRPTRRRNLKIVQARRASTRREARVAAIWFNQAWLATPAGRGTWLSVHGTLLPAESFKVERHELADGRRPAHRRARSGVPGQRGGLEHEAAGGTRERALPRIRFLPDPLPALSVDGEGLPLRADALTAAHRPRDASEAEAARERLALEELLALQLGLPATAGGRSRAATSAPALGEPGS